ncbi:unnamed protein product [Chrysoparadoxa australica]
MTRAIRRHIGLSGGEQTPTMPEVSLGVMGWVISLWRPDIEILVDWCLKVVQEQGAMCCLL